MTSPSQTLRRPRPQPPREPPSATPPKRASTPGGDSVYQPPRIRHREVAHSDDLELLEITSPAEFAASA